MCMYLEELLNTLLFPFPILVWGTLIQHWNVHHQKCEHVVKKFQSWPHYDMPEQTENQPKTKALMNSVLLHFTGMQERSLWLHPDYRISFLGGSLCPHSDILPPWGQNLSASATSIYGLPGDVLIVVLLWSRTSDRKSLVFITWEQCLAALVVCFYFLIQYSWTVSTGVLFQNPHGYWNPQIPSLN